jgi:hypothetical protein
MDLAEHGGVGRNNRGKATQAFEKRMTGRLMFCRDVVDRRHESGRDVVVGPTIVVSNYRRGGRWRHGVISV